MNHLESRLASFFSQGGGADTKKEVDYPTWRLPPQRNRAAIPGKGAAAIWMSARVIAIDPTGRGLIVKRVLPLPGQMKGLRFWRQAGRKAVAFDPVVKSRLDNLRTWLADRREKPTYELIIEDWVDVFVNGWAKSLTDLRPGDRIGICFPTSEGAVQTLHPMQIRAYRFP
jgi:hypothetical protein